MTIEQWNAACDRAGQWTEINQQEGWHRHYPPLGDPATVLQMLEWLLVRDCDLTHADKFYYFFGPDGDTLEAHTVPAKDLSEAIVKAVLALLAEAQHA